MTRESWWLAGVLALGCASRGENTGAPDASTPAAALTLAAPDRGLPDAGLTLKPMAPPAIGAAPTPRLELETPTPGASAGVRAPPENDAPPPKTSPLRAHPRPYSPTPPKLDAQGRGSVPRVDPNQPLIDVPPKGPINANAPPTDR